MHDLRPTLPFLGRMESLPIYIGRLSVLLAALGGLLTLGGCATYSSSFATVEQQLAAQRYDDALNTIEKSAKDRKDRVLYLLNKGMVLRMKRDFVASNQSFEAAKQEMERLYAESVSENALSFVVNDATVSYAGEDYEQVLVHLYMALNYLELGQRDEARVEALQMDTKLREIGEKIPANKFTEDALSRYLTGMIYEELGEWSDAMIAYRKAYEAYKKYQANFSLPVPPMLKLDLLRMSQREGLKDELSGYQKEFGVTSEKMKTLMVDPDGELVFILNDGLAPIKREKVIATWAPPPSVAAEAAKSPRQVHSATPTPPVLVNIALPYYESRPQRIWSARIRVAGQQADTEMMENIDAIARQSLDARMAAITARAVARAVAKAAIQQSVDKAGKKNGKNNDAGAQLVASLVVRAASLATERADTRSWLTLPANVQMARLPLQPGNYDVTVELLGKDSEVIETRVIPQVTIRKDRKTYLTQRAVP